MIRGIVRRLCGARAIEGEWAMFEAFARVSSAGADGGIEAESRGVAALGFRRCGPAARRPGGPAARRPGGPAARRPRRPGGPAARRPGGMTCARRLAGARRPASSSPSPAGPPLRALTRAPGASAPGPFRLLPALALLLAALSLSPFAAVPAAAAVLVSNDGQSYRVQSGLNQGFPIGNQATEWVYQRFTTGAESGGYTLTNIQARMFRVSGVTAADIAKVKAQLWTGGDDADAPSMKVADLTVPATALQNANNHLITFAAPSNTILLPNTNYWLVISSSRFTSGKTLGWFLTPSDNEDSASAAGWSIADRYWWRQAAPPGPGLSGSTPNDSLKIVVNGAADRPPAAPAGLSIALTVGSGDLAVSWTAPTGTVTGYDVHYTWAPKTGDSAVDDDAAVQTGMNPEGRVGWVDAGPTAARPPRRRSGRTSAPRSGCGCARRTATARAPGRTLRAPRSPWRRRA